MDLRNMPESLQSHERPAVRRMTIQQELECNLSCLGTEENRIGTAEEYNCENMFGTVPIPVGYAGPLNVTFSSQENTDIHLPLATTEAALVASINRGCKVLTHSTGARTSSKHIGISRSIAWKIHGDIQQCVHRIHTLKHEWIEHAESTSQHLTILSYDIDVHEPYLFVTIYADTDEAMGMNMVTIAADAIGHILAEKIDATLITIAANIDSDKKPSKRTKNKGRGYTVDASAILEHKTIEKILKTSPKVMLEVAEAKLHHGTDIAEALGRNLHAANTIAALYSATGQDIAHTVEGSLTETTFTQHTEQTYSISVHCPAILVGIRGGGTMLPAQQQCLQMLLRNTKNMHPCKQLAESIGAAVLAGELSLLAALGEGTLAKSHQRLAR